MINVALFSFGNERELKRCVYSVLSLSSWFQGENEGFRIIIYTDNPPFFKTYLQDFEVVYEYVSLEEIQAQKEKTGYMYRIKIAIIEKVLQQYPEDDLLFIDNDTFFISHPKQLFNSIKPGKSFMDSKEYTFEQGTRHFKWQNPEKATFDFIDLIESKSFLVNEKEVHFNKNQYIWNSGVLGLSKDIKKFIPDVFSLTDEFYLKTAWRISEQIAFALVLDTVSEISEAKKYIYHYWHYKDRVDPRINKLLTDEFISLPKKEKLSLVQKSTKKLYKLLCHEQMVSNAKWSVRDKDYKNGVKYASNALVKMPLNDDFVDILKFRFSRLF